MTKADKENPQIVSTFFMLSLNKIFILTYRQQALSQEYKQTTIGDKNTNTKKTHHPKL